MRPKLRGRPSAIDKTFSFRHRHSRNKSVSETLNYKNAFGPYSMLSLKLLFRERWSIEEPGDSQIDGSRLRDRCSMRETQGYYSHEI